MCALLCHTFIGNGSHLESVGVAGQEAHNGCTQHVHQSGATA